jgi:hypothetical protein
MTRRMTALSRGREREPGAQSGDGPDRGRAQEIGGQTFGLLTDA